MTNVYAFPPVGLTGWAFEWLQPGSKSAGFTGGGMRTSSYQRERRKASAIVTGIGADRNAGGYVENLKRLIAGGEHLFRIECLPPLWARGLTDRYQSDLLTWTTGVDDLVWTAGGASMIWGTGEFALRGAPTTDSGWNALTVTGGPPNTLIARPSELITVTDGTSTETSRVLTAATTDGSGNATIRVFDTFTLTGMVSIGGTESIIMRLEEPIPFVAQPSSGHYTYTIDGIEAFADEYETLVELDPWR